MTTRFEFGLVPVWTLFGLLYKNSVFEIVLFQDRIVQRPSYHDWNWDTQQEVKKIGKYHPAHHYIKNS